MIKGRIDAYFKAHRDEFIESIRRLVAVNSLKGDPLPGMPFGPGPAEGLQTVLDIADSLGLITHNYENYVGTADICSLDTQLGILAHVDIVDVGANWTTDPFGGEVKDGKLYGRGASDDKGPVIASLYALAAVKALDVPLKYNARLIIGTDEESGSADIRYYFSKEKAPPHVFSPDGEFPVMNTEKGGLRTSFEGSFADNAALPRIVSIHGGYRVNVVPPEAEAVIEGLDLSLVKAACHDAQRVTGARFTLTDKGGGIIHIHAEGKGGHASLPETAVNGVTSMLNLLAGLPFSDSDGFRAVQGLNSLFPHGDYYGEAAGIKMSDEISGALTFNFSIFKYNGAELYGFFDSRTPLCATSENTMDVLEMGLARFDVQLKRSGFSKPHHTPADTPFVQTLLRAYEAYTGQQGYCKAVGGGTYVHGIEGGVAFGCTMPGVDPRPHGADEFVIVEDILTSARMFTQIIIDICAGEV